MSRYCPNCGQPAEVSKDGLYCEVCDTVFTVTDKGARVKKTGKIDDLEDRITKLEANFPGDDPAADPDDLQDDPAGQDPDEDQDDDFGFIVG